MGWEADGYEFAWTYEALLTPGGCILDLSHCPVSAVLLGSWARLNGFSASMLLSTSMGFSLHFLFFWGGRALLRGKKKHPSPQYLTCSALNYRHHPVNFGQVELNCRICSWPFSILAVRRHTVVVIFIKKKRPSGRSILQQETEANCKEGCFGNRRLHIQWLVASCD